MLEFEVLRDKRRDCLHEFRRLLIPASHQNRASASIWSPTNPNQCRKIRSLTHNWESPIQLSRKAL
jgi:hypothetical protein